MVTFLALLRMAYTFRNLLGSLELPTFNCQTSPAGSSVSSVGKQSPCLLSFLITSYDRERVRAAHKFGNHRLLLCKRSMFFTYSTQRNVAISSHYVLPLKHL